MKLFNPFIYLFLVVLMATQSLSAAKVYGHSTELPFDLVNGMLIVTANVNDQQGKYIFDTGCPRLIINERVTSPTFQLSTPDGDAASTEKHIQKLSLGSLSITDIDAWAMDLQQISTELDQEIDGILGWSYFKHGVVYIDFENKVIHITNTRQLDILKSDQYHIIQSPIEWVGDDLALVSLEIEGAKEKFIFDTGAPLNLKNVTNLNDKSSHVTQKSITIEGVKIENGQFKFGEISHLGTTKEGQPIGGILSVSGLNAAKVIIDGEKNRVFILWSKSDLLAAN